MKHLLLLIVFVFAGLALGSAQEIDFSDNSRYSIITCAPGTEVYSAYGHTAIRVIDPISGLDLVFNYGIFSFSSENFIWKFVKGETDYQLGVYSYKSFIQEYLKEDRTVWEQRLNLNQEEKDRLERRILFDYRPENRVYRYNFFFDNCATRVRDRILESIQDSVEVAEMINDPQSFRQLIDHYISRYAWMKFGISLAVAKPAERIASFEEEMFLPEYLMSNLELMMVSDSGQYRALVGERLVLNAGSDKKPGAEIPPSIIFSVLLVLMVIVYYFFAEEHPWVLIISYLFYFLIGLTGIVLTFLTGFSEHPAMAPNYHLLWALPTHLLVFLIWPFKRFKKVVKYYWIACIPYYVLVSLMLLLTNQYMAPSIFIINGIMFVSAIFVVRMISDKAHKAKLISTDTQ